MRALAAALESVRATRSRTAKETVLARYLATLDDASLPHAARMLAGRVFPVDDRRAARAGGVVCRTAAAAATGWDLETVTDSARAAGDTGEAIGLLIAADPNSHSRPGLSLLELVTLAERLAATPRPARRIALLADALRASPPLAAKYLIKLLAGGLRVGAQQGVVEGAIARAFDVPQDVVRAALSRAADVGEVALHARRGTLETVRVRPGRPVGFMLATPVQSIPSAPAGDGWIVEDKLDGIRAQVHRDGAEVRLFARSGDPLDGVFPEIEDAMRWEQSAEAAFVLDGEIVAIEPDGTYAPFAALQERLNRTRVSARTRSERPVAFVAFDLLYRGGREPDGALLAAPWTSRRAALEHVLAHAERVTDGRIRVLPYTALASDDLEVLRREALERGAEGLLLKRSDAAYESGRRGQAWVKVKEAYATLDVVVTAAEEGHGKRRGLLSDYTFAVRRGEELLNVGKAYSGLTDEEIEALTPRFTRATIARYGRVRTVRPEVVLEVAFDGISRSARHRSGFALRFPRIVRVRRDKTPAEANTVDEVEALFARQGASRARRS